MPEPLVRRATHPRRRVERSGQIRARSSLVFKAQFAHIVGHGRDPRIFGGQEAQIRRSGPQRSDGKDCTRPGCRSKGNGFGATH
jgi:hypothetical protein